MHQIKPELRRQDLEGIHLPSFRFSWKLKKLCRVGFFVFESWQTGVKSQGKTITARIKRRCTRGFPVYASEKYPLYIIITSDEVLINDTGG
jgi:hypothetical protein